MSRLIGLCGRSCSGKTTVARHISRTQHMTHLETDRFSRVSTPSRWGQYANWECPESVRMDKMKESLERLKNGRPAWIPSARGTEVFDERIDPLQKVIADGFLLYVDDDIASIFDVKIYLDVSDETILHRRAARDVRHPLCASEYIRQVVIPASKTYDALQKRKADVVIDANGDVKSVCRAVERIVSEK